MGRKREEAVPFRAQRSHPVGGWVLAKGQLPALGSVQPELWQGEDGKRMMVGAQSLTKG